MWQAYTAANALFASVVSHCLDSPTDTIWVHNYHLLLLPSFLRTKLPRAKIGLFIHTPFPSSDVFRVLPTRQNILSSMMASDLLGFHTFDYARHFLSCAKRVMDLDYETLPGGSLGIKALGRFVSILISHVGIDSEMFKHTASLDSVQAKVEALKLKYGSRRMIIGSSDLDSVKGGLLKFQAYDRFFHRFPQWVGQVVFVDLMLQRNQSLKLDHEQDMNTLVRQTVEEIHRKYGPNVLDVLELHEPLPLNDAVAYFNASDVCIVSQFWDGLNLLPFEYTVSQNESNPGALIISEFMGCSRTLNGVLRVNPWSLDSVAVALNVALNMSIEERKANHSRRLNYCMQVRKRRRKQKRRRGRRQKFMI
jgi:trehalose 6-phosphate synthase/phosphatase